jgi:hypothetical protein
MEIQIISRNRELEYKKTLSKTPAQEVRENGNQMGHRQQIQCHFIARREAVLLVFLSH